MAKQSNSNGPTISILDVLSAAKNDDIEAIDKEIADRQERIKGLENEIASLSAIRKVIHIKLFGKPERKKPERKAKKAAASGGGLIDASGIEPKPGSLGEQIAGIIRQHGPGTALAIARKLGINEGAVNMSVARNRDFFVILDGEKVGIASMHGA